MIVTTLHLYTYGPEGPRIAVEEVAAFVESARRVGVTWFKYVIQTEDPEDDPDGICLHDEIVGLSFTTGYSMGEPSDLA